MCSHHTKNQPITPESRRVHGGESYDKHETDQYRVDLAFVNPTKSEVRIKVYWSTWWYVGSCCHLAPHYTQLVETLCTFMISCGIMIAVSPVRWALVTEEYAPLGYAHDSSMPYENRFTQQYGCATACTFNQVAVNKLVEQPGDICN